MPSSERGRTLHLSLALLLLVEGWEEEQSPHCSWQEQLRESPLSPADALKVAGHLPSSTGPILYSVALSGS